MQSNQEETVGRRIEMTDASKCKRRKAGPQKQEAGTWQDERKGDDYGEETKAGNKSRRIKESESRVEE